MYRTKHPRRCTRVYFNADTFHSHREWETVREKESLYETYNLFLYFTVSSSVDAITAAADAVSAAAGGGGVIFCYAVHYDSVSLLFMIVCS